MLAVQVGSLGMGVSVELWGRNGGCEVRIVVVWVGMVAVGCGCGYE